MDHDTQVSEGRTGPSANSFERDNLPKSAATCPTGLGQRARLELVLLDSQVARELGIIASDLLDEALGFLAADERLA